MVKLFRPRRLTYIRIYVCYDQLVLNLNFAVPYKYILQSSTVKSLLSIFYDPIKNSVIVELSDIIISSYSYYHLINGAYQVVTFKHLEPAYIDDVGIIV